MTEEEKFPNAMTKEEFEELKKTPPRKGEKEVVDLLKQTELTDEDIFNLRVTLPTQEERDRMSKFLKVRLNQVKRALTHSEVMALFVQVTFTKEEQEEMIQKGWLKKEFLISEEE